jgi:hypothetical protein
VVETGEKYLWTDTPPWTVEPVEKDIHRYHNNITNLIHFQVSGESVFSWLRYCDT